MVADLHTIKNKEIKNIITQKHAIASFIDTQCIIQLSHSGYHISCEIPGVGPYSDTTVHLGDIYFHLERKHGEAIFRWFDKNTIKTEIYCSMNYFMNQEKLPLDKAIFATKCLMGRSAENDTHKIALLEEAFSEYLRDIKANLESVDKFNFPNG